MINNLLQFDQSFFYWFNNLSGQNEILDFCVTIIGKYLIYFVPVILLISWFIYKKETDRLSMIKTTLVSVFLWQIPTKIISWIWFRPRPFTDLSNTKELFFHAPSYSFPSDHATFLAALATYFYLLGYKKVGIWIGIVTFFISITRIISGLHYPGDILAGWVLGIIGAILIYLLDKYIDKYIAKPLLNLAKYLHLV